MSSLSLFLLISLGLTICHALLPGTSSANDISGLRKKSPPNLAGTLYPQATETRDLRNLDGIWNFRKSPTDPEYGYRNGWYEQDLDKVRAMCWLLLGQSYADHCDIIFPVLYIFHFLTGCWLQILNHAGWIITPRPSNPFNKYTKHPGFAEKWFENDLHKTGPVIPMPVPASFNDIGEDKSLRDHVGLVWYDRRFQVPSWWLKNDQRVWLRFSSVHYAAQVWVNGKSVAHHEIGHLPFEVEITEFVKAGEHNLLTVAVDNTLLSDTIPQGSVRDIIVNNQITLEQTYSFDFFNYAGIHRSVFLYSTPRVYIDDVIVNTDLQGLTGFIVYNVTYKGSADDVQCLIQLFDKNDTLVTSANDCAGLLEVPNAKFWWPYLMNPHPGYLYTMKASLIGDRGEVTDTYNQKVGIRTVTWTNTTVYLNEKPIYMRGFGMHEDSDLRGKGWDQVLWTKNFNLIRWIGANAFRTSHYPYAEEIYQMADEQGIMIIDECPSVDTDFFSDSLLTKHKQSLTELIRRDKNHPSVVMWSIANEPRTQYKDADAYFGEVARHVRSMDLSRPITMALAQGFNVDKTGQHCDVISFNRYNGWYQNTGSLVNIAANVRAEAIAWHQKYNKPTMMLEYGADTIAGLHLLPDYVWSEEYQVAVISEHFKAFDKLRKKGFFMGEFIWNFADFKTAQTITRVGGNKKGIFTRSRQPKAAAHHLRRRYFQLAGADDGAEIPDDLTSYTSDDLPIKHNEL